MKNEALERPNIKDYCSDASLSDMHSTYVSNQGIWKYLQSLDAYCDELESRLRVDQPVADTASTCNLKNVIVRFRAVDKTMKEMQPNGLGRYELMNAITELGNVLGEETSL